MNNHLLNIFQSQDGEGPAGIYSVCSSNKYVLKAAMLQAVKNDSFLLIEPTANQVNQFGGYTGMRPKDFVALQSSIAHEVGLKKEKIILGGDHLGPNPWRTEPAEKALEKSKKLVQEYVKAGFRKLHLDTSIPCADDGVDFGASLEDEVVAKRAAKLCGIAETTFKNIQHKSLKPVYVIGTEVPTPGGTKGPLHEIKITEVSAAKKTFETTKKAFLQRGLENAWSRVIAQVVQPGVEFGNNKIVEYDPAKASDLSDFIKEHDDMVFEAHSTDYQPRECLKNLVRDNFAILKVGPWLTFSFREAIFGLSYMEEELLQHLKSASLSDIRRVLDITMTKNPEAWENHYDGNESRLKFLRKYSYSDRSRYYWQRRPVKKALTRLFKNLRTHEIPMPLISQFLPGQFKSIKKGYLENDPEEIALHKIQEVTKKYAQATGQGGI